MLEKQVKLDTLGQFYGSVMDQENPGNFTLRVDLKEEVNQDVLQSALNDVVKRLPFLSSRTIPKFFGYYNELLKNPPKIQPEGPAFTPFYKEGEGHALRVTYGTSHFTVEVTHCLVDGRSLLQITQALTVRYFELLGIDIEKEGIIDCNDNFKASEVEEAYRKFATPTKRNIPKGKPQKKIYQQKISKKTAFHSISHVIEIDKIKKQAKNYGVTIGEFLVALIFLAYAKERQKDQETGDVVISIPIDCRSYFPTETLRNFVTTLKVTMPETQDLPTMLKQIKPQFAQINKEFLQEEINLNKPLPKYLPRFLQDIMMKLIKQNVNNESTTMLSNLGMVKLSKLIEERVEKFTFSIEADEVIPHTFATVGFRNYLTLAITTCEEDGKFISEFISLIEKNLNGVD